MLMKTYIVFLTLGVSCLATPLPAPASCTGSSVTSRGYGLVCTGSSAASKRATEESQADPDAGMGLVKKEGAELSHAIAKTDGMGLVKKTGMGIIKRTGMGIISSGGDDA